MSYGKQYMLGLCWCWLRHCVPAGMDPNAQSAVVAFDIWEICLVYLSVPCICGNVYVSISGDAVQKKAKELSINNLCI